MPKKAEVASTVGITRNHSRRFPLRCKCRPCSALSWSLFISSSSFIKSSRILKFSVPDNGEHDRHKEESGDSREQQAPNHCAAKRCVLLSSLTHPDCHRDHTDDHGERRHHHRSQSGGTSFER